jgi:predicted RNase H-like nuclease (RuvC/YqgF family)
MPHITKRTFGPLFAVILTCFGSITAQQSPGQQSGRTQSAAPQLAQATLQQQNDQLRDQVAQLQMQVKDLQAAIDDLKSQQQVVTATAKETHEVVLDSRVAQKQGREDLNSLGKAVVRDERQIDNLERQVNSMMRDLQRVKTKVGLF